MRLTTKSKPQGVLIPITLFWAGFFLTYLLLAAFAPGLMGERVLGVSLGFLLSVAQVLMTWLVAFLYLRRAERVFEPLERRAADVAARTSPGRFERRAPGAPDRARPAR